MKTAASVACILACSLLGAQRLLAQGCAVTMTKNFSSYITESTDGTHIFTSVVVDGSSSCTPSPGCPCNSATHTPKALNQLGSVGGWGSGTPQCVNCYLSYTNSQSIVAIDGVAYPFTSAGQVSCSLAGVLFSTVSTVHNEVKHQNCGGNKGELLTIFVTPQSQTCNSTSVYTAPMSIGGTGITFVTSTSASATTDDDLLLDLIRGAALDPLCPNKSHGTLWCYKQSYKAIANQHPTTGNFKWDVQITCGTKLIPDIDQVVNQAFQCN